MLFRLFLLIISLAGLINTALAGERIIIDAAGRSVKIPDRIERIIAAGPPASVLAYVLAPEKLVGWVREPSAQEKEFLAPAYRDLPTIGRLTGKGTTANLEVVLAAKPDLIIDAGAVDATYASLADKVQEQTGIPYILIDGTFANTPEMLRQVADILGVQERGEILATYSEASITRLNEILERVPQSERPRVYYGRGPEGLETGLSGSITMEVLAAVGATNVADEAGAGSLGNVSVENILAWNPDVILTLDAGFQQKVLHDPNWANVKAVKDGRVFHSPTLPYGWFDSPPGVNRMIGISWLTAVLYPHQAKGDLRAETREFYKLFYHVDLSEEQIDLLLANSRSSQ